MIVKIMSRGTSFKGVANYVLHDPKEKTNERVGFTHTRNLAHEDALGAVHEMYLTADYAETLKQEAGIRAGGRTSDRPVKHISLNWSPDEQPSPGDMRQAADGFLKNMGWQDHQALIVAHNDKHPHIHIVLNMVHPENGVLLNDSFEKRRAQSWALNYEAERGQVLCEQRLLNAEEREASPTRPVWLIFKGKEKEFEGLNHPTRENEVTPAANENSENSPEYSHWKKLKEFQKDERLLFVAETKMQIKELRNSLHREVREEFRGKWSEYYDHERQGGDTADLKEIKSTLIAAQTHVLKERCDEPFAELREARNMVYRELLDHQIDVCATFRTRQEAGLDNSVFLDYLDKTALQRGVVSTEVADNREKPTSSTDDRGTTAVAVGHEVRDNSGVKPALAIATGAAEGIGTGILSLFESIADGIMGAKAAPKRQVPKEPEPNPIKPANDNPPKAIEQSRQDDELDWYERQRSRGRD